MHHAAAGVTLAAGSVQSCPARVTSEGARRPPSLLVSVARELYHRWQTVIHELAKFGVVGAVAYVVDVGIYNLLHVGMSTGPITAKTLSTVVAATVAYVGNRHWSFKHRARTGTGREYGIFIVLSAIGLGIALAFLGFGYYVLNQRSALASNVWGNLVGTGLATIFRFWAYKRYVFLHPDHPKVASLQASTTERVAMADSEHAADARR